MNTEDLHAQFDAYFSGATNLTKNQWREALRGLGGNSSGFAREPRNNVVPLSARPTSPEILFGEIKGEPLQPAPQPQFTPSTPPTITSIMEFIYADAGELRFANVNAEDTGPVVP